MLKRIMKFLPNVNLNAAFFGAWQKEKQFAAEAYENFKLNAHFF